MITRRLASLLLANSTLPAKKQPIKQKSAQKAFQVKDVTELKLKANGFVNQLKSKNCP